MILKVYLPTFRLTSHSNWSSINFSLRNRENQRTKQKVIQKTTKMDLQKTALQFSQNYYHQLDGLTMGSLLSPAMADICLNWLIN